MPIGLSRHHNKCSGRVVSLPSCQSFATKDTRVGSEGVLKDITQKLFSCELYSLLIIITAKNLSHVDITTTRRRFWLHSIRVPSCFNILCLFIRVKDGSFSALPGRSCFGVIINVVKSICGICWSTSGWRCVISFCSSEWATS